MFGPLLEVEMSKKCTPLWREAHFEVKMYKTHQGSDHLEVEMSKKRTQLWGEAHFEVKMLKNSTGLDLFWKLRCRTSARRCGAKHISKSKVQKSEGYGALLDDQMCFARQAQRIAHLVKSEQNVRVLKHFRKTMAGMGHLKRIFKDACRLAGAVQKTCSSEMLGGQGTDFLRGVAFWSIRSVGFLR